MGIERRLIPDEAETGGLSCPTLSVANVAWVPESFAGLEGTPREALSHFRATRTHERTFSSPVGMQSCRDVLPVLIALCHLGVQGRPPAGY